MRNIENRRKRIKREKVMQGGSGKVCVKIIGYLVIVIIVVSVLLLQKDKSIVWGVKSRFNMSVVAESGRTMFVSFDPVERQIYAIDYPKKLAIKSRSVGEYKVDSLYPLGSYEDRAGDFTRQKLQGFMRIPISGYLTVSDNGEEGRNLLQKSLIRELWVGEPQNNLTVIDKLILITRVQNYIWFTGDEDELIKEGVLIREDDGYTYDESRLKKYVGERFFDWEVAREEIRMAVVNESGSDGMGYDVADFLENAGIDVVNVKGIGEMNEESRMVIEEESLQDSATAKIVGRYLNIETIEEGDTSRERADIVLYVGSDMLAIF